jgi:hypothetical protein
LGPVDSTRCAITWPARLCRCVEALQFGVHHTPYKTWRWECKTSLNSSSFGWRARAVCMKRSVPSSHQRSEFGASTIRIHSDGRRPGRTRNRIPGEHGIESWDTAECVVQAYRRTTLDETGLFSATELFVGFVGAEGCDGARDGCGRDMIRRPALVWPRIV